MVVSQCVPLRLVEDEHLCRFQARQLGLEGPDFVCPLLRLAARRRGLRLVAHDGERLCRVCRASATCGCWQILRAAGRWRSFGLA
jgi:hypothetical protein